MARTRTRDARGSLLEATHQLLEERSLEEITVFDVINAAGVSRATFYLYFESKNAAVATLAQAAMAQIYDGLWRPFLAGAEPPSEVVLTEHFLETIEMWRAHRAVLVAAAAAWRADPEAFYQWGVLWAQYVDDVTAYIERARTGRLAPPGLHAGALAAMLVWLAETTVYLLMTGASAHLSDELLAASTLAGVWMRTIYGEAPLP